MQHRSRYGIALGAVAIAGAIVVTLACNGSIASVDTDAGVVAEAGDASHPETSSTDVQKRPPSPDGGVCRLVDETCQGAEYGWACCSPSQGIAYDPDQDCMGAKAKVGCIAIPGPESGECAGTDEYACVMRVRDGGTEIFRTFENNVDRLSPYDDLVPCDPATAERVSRAAEMKRTCPQPIDSGAD